MAVLVEAGSFIARRDRLDECWPMGSEGFIADAPNGSVCADEYLIRIGFMGPDSTSAFIYHAIAQGLTRFEPDGSAADFVTVHQVVGLLTPCHWLIVGSVDHEGHQIRAARWVGDESQNSDASGRIGRLHQMACHRRWSLIGKRGKIALSSESPIAERPVFKKLYL
jgi:hypothetical protein